MSYIVPRGTRICSYLDICSHGYFTSLWPKCDLTFTGIDIHKSKLKHTNILFSFLCWEITVLGNYCAGKSLSWEITVQGNICAGKSLCWEITVRGNQCAGK